MNKQAQNLKKFNQDKYFYLKYPNNKMKMNYFLQNKAWKILFNHNQMRITVLQTINNNKLKEEIAHL